MLKLAVTFQKSDDKHHQWSFTNPNPNLTADDLRIAMENLTNLEIFEKDGVTLFQKAISANYVETIETAIF